MKNHLFALAIVSAIGCSSTTNEPTAESHDKVVAWLVSPPNFHEDNLLGTWVPVDPGQFEGGSTASKTVAFTKENGARSYRLSDDATPCTGECAQNGVWILGDNPIESGIIGVRVNTRSTVVQGNEKSLFVWGMASGEVRLVDLDTCSFLLFSCKNTWTKTPMLTEDDL